MSKQSEAKKEQDYFQTAACCKNCSHYRSELVQLNRWAGDLYSAEKNKRCGIGGFAVSSMGSCKLFSHVRAVGMTS